MGHQAASAPGAIVLSCWYANDIDGITTDVSAGGKAMNESADLVVNGALTTLRLPGGTPLLAILRNDLGLNGPKFGCGLGQCGACTVLIDGMPARSCVTPLSVAVGRSIVTLEGLAVAGRLHPVQQAFVECQAAQCGYCLNGMVMTVVALLDRDADPDDATVRRELSGNLCRCGTHVEILRAAHRAVELARQWRAVA